MRVSYKIQDKFDFILFLPTVFLLIIGLMAVFSSTFDHPTASGNFERQLFWVILALIVFFMTYYLPEQTFKFIGVFTYIISILFLVAVLLIGKKIYGAKSWLIIGPMGFQPSEFAKIGTMLLLSYWLTERKENIKNIKDIGIALLIGFI